MKSSLPFILTVLMVATPIYSAPENTVKTSAEPSIPTILKTTKTNVIEKNSETTAPITPARTWSYSGKTGPAYWGQFDEADAVCAIGKKQSPINIKGTFLEGNQSLTINYEAAPMIIIDDGTTELLLNSKQTIIFDGHGIQLNFPSHDASESITYAEKTYNLIQFHFHTPAENQLNSKKYPLEIHFVHQTTEGDTAVIGVLVQEGPANAELQKIIDHFPSQEGVEEVIKNETINPANLLPTHKDFYSFEGSLTTPPCTQGLNWIVMAEPITASREQIAAFKGTVPGGNNARPIQKLNDREISHTKT